jgi:hypothetical protein
LAQFGHGLGSIAGLWSIRGDSIEVVLEHFWRAHWDANSFRNMINEAHTSLLTGPGVTVAIQDARALLFAL